MIQICRAVNPFLKASYNIVNGREGGVRSPHHCHNYQRERRKRKRKRKAAYINLYIFTIKLTKSKDGIEVEILDANKLCYILYLAMSVLSAQVCYSIVEFRNPNCPCLLVIAAHLGYL